MRRTLLMLILAVTAMPVFAGPLPTTPDETMVGNLVNSWVQGGLRVTDRIFDFAIQGRGFFVIQHPNDDERWAYTRYGAFELDHAGYLVQRASHLRVFGYADKAFEEFAPLKLASYAHSPNNPSAFVKSFQVGLNGEIEAIYSDGTKLTTAYLAIALMPNPRKLTRLSTHNFETNQGSGPASFAPAQADGRGSVYAASLEELDDKYIYGSSLDPE